MSTSSTKDVYLFHGDILGFKKIICNLSMDEAKKRMDIFISITKKLAQQNNITNIKFHSDSIIACVDEGKDISDLIQFVKLLLEKSITESFPIRGAITKGELHWDEIVYGKALLNAYNLEKMQDWIGVLIDIPNIQTMDKNNNTIVYPIPKKEKEEYQLHSAIKWKVPRYKNLMHYLTTNGLGGVPGIGEMLNHKLITKITNTIIFAIYSEHIDQNGLDFSNKFLGTSPIEFFDINCRSKS